MVAGFRRTISFPAPKSPTPPSNKSAAYRARSASLPCRFHPLVLQLDDDVADLRALVGRLLSGASAEAVAEGAEQLGRVLVSLSDLLHHPQAQDPLRRLGRSPFAERLLDDFLRLADAHGSFQEALVDLKRDVAEALAAIRRHDGARLASALRSQRRVGKELARLAATAKDGAARPSRLGLGLGLGGSSAAEVEVAGLLAEAAAATASASAALFNTVAAMSASASAAACSCKRTAALMCLIKKVPEEEKETMALMERLEELEECIDDLESGSDKVFRSLVQTRVALLNVHTNIF